MRLCILIFMVGLCLPRPVGSYDYKEIRTPARILQIKDGEVTITNRTDRFKRLYYFIASHPKAQNPLEITEILYNCPYPEIMAAIASAESGFDAEAVGPEGEVSMFQILDWKGGDPTDTRHALSEAIRVFEEKRMDWKHIPASIKAYNGSGIKAEKYKARVLNKIRLIQTTRL